MSTKLKTIILRFRDMNARETIKLHKDIIKEKKCVWWGWWSKPQEKVPMEEINVLNQRIKQEGKLKIFLFDSGEQKLYEAMCSEIQYHNDEVIPVPEMEKSPCYYNEQHYKIWFKFSGISESLSNENATAVLHQYSYLRVDKFFVSESSPFLPFYDKQIFSLQELEEQQRTIWFLKDKETGDRTHEIHSYKSVFGLNEIAPDTYKVLATNSILWLSDLHFSEEHHNFGAKAGDTNQLSIRLNDELNKIGYEEPSYIIVSGDLTYTAKKTEFDMVESFMSDMNSIFSLDSSSYAIVPGNHDIAFSEEKFDPKKPVEIAFDKAKEAYVNFYKQYFRVEPEGKLFSVNRFLTNNLQPVEIICINSSLLQQQEKHFQGMGFVGNDQLREVEQYLKATHDSKTFRILVMHHHLIPVIYKENPKADTMYSMMLDCGAVNQFIINNKISLVLHGHTHKEFYAELIKKSNNNAKYKYYIIGLGSTGVNTEELSEGCSNMFATLNVEEKHIIVKGYSIYPNGQNSEEIFKHIIPLREEQND